MRSGLCCPGPLYRRGARPGRRCRATAGNATTLAHDIVRAAARLTTPGLAEKTTRAVASYLVDEVAAQYADASLVVVG